MCSQGGHPGPVQVLPDQVVSKQVLSAWEKGFPVVLYPGVTPPPPIQEDSHSTGDMPLAVIQEDFLVFIDL